MQFAKPFLTISLITIFIVSCSSVQVTEESVRESSIATVEVSTSDTYETKTTAVSTSATVYFDFDKSNIKAEAAFELDKLVQIMNKYPEMTVSIESHTDSKGPSSYNQRLSERRAKTTSQYVISKGIDSSRLSSAGKGESLSLIHI